MSGRSANQRARYSNFVPTDSQKVIRARHCERVLRKLKKTGIVDAIPRTVGLFGFNMNELDDHITQLRNDGHLILTEYFHKRNKYGELIKYKRFRLVTPETDDE